MKEVERMLCTECGPRKLVAAGLKYSRKPGKDGIARCDFCDGGKNSRERVCKCYGIRIGR